MILKCLIQRWLITLTILLGVVLFVSCAPVTKHPLTLSPGRARGTLELADKHSEPDSLKAFVESMQKKPSLDFAQTFAAVGAQFTVHKQRAPAPVVSNNRRNNGFNAAPQMRTGQGQTQNPTADIQRQNADLKKQLQATQNQLNAKATTQNQQVRHANAPNLTTIDVVEKDGGSSQENLDVTIYYSNNKKVEISGHVASGDLVKEIKNADETQIMEYACLNTDCTFNLLILKLYKTMPAVADPVLVSVNPYLILKMATTPGTSTLKTASQVSALSLFSDVANGINAMAITFAQPSADIFITPPSASYTVKTDLTQASLPLVNSQGTKASFKADVTSTGVPFYTFTGDTGALTFKITNDFGAFNPTLKNDSTGDTETVKPVTATPTETPLTDDLNSLDSSSDQ